MRVLVLGASGMLGSAMVRILDRNSDLEVYATLRNGALCEYLPAALAPRLYAGVDALDQRSLADIFCRVRPHVVVNCVGVIKQVDAANDPLIAIPVNAVLPHRLARLSESVSARLIHVSTDCVFSGVKGNYVESDVADATDLYGRSKLLGELHYSHTVTLRTSLIGHELCGCNSLLDWFLSQRGHCRGFTRTVFSGLPTVELARIVSDVIIPRPDLCGLYHVASEPISKHDLLEQVALEYGKVIEIVPTDMPVIDRSLNAGRFRSACGYSPPHWSELLSEMHSYYRETAR